MTKTRSKSKMFVFGVFALVACSVTLLYMEDRLVSLESLSWHAMETLEKTVKYSWINYQWTHVQPTDEITASLSAQCERERKLIVFVQLSRTGAGAIMKHLFKAPSIVVDESDCRWTSHPLPGAYAGGLAAEYCRSKCVVKGFYSRADVEALRAACAALNRTVVAFTLLRHPVERAYSLFLWPEPGDAYEPVQMMLNESAERLTESPRRVETFFRRDAYALRSDFFQTFFNDSMLWQLGHQRHASERARFDYAAHCDADRREALHACLHRRALELLASLDYVGSYEDLKATFLHLSRVIFPNMAGTRKYQVKFLLGTIFGYPYNHVLKHGAHLSAAERALIESWTARDLALWRDAQALYGVNAPFENYVDFLMSADFFAVLACYGAAFALLAAAAGALLVLVTLPCRAVLDARKNGCCARAFVMAHAIVLTSLAMLGAAALVAFLVAAYFVDNYWLNRLRISAWA